MNIAALKQKPITKSPKEVRVLFGREPVDTAANASHPVFEQESPNEAKAFIVDRRNETTLDRDVIMARLKNMIKVPVAQAQAQAKAQAKAPVSKEIKESGAFATIAELMEEEKEEKEEKEKKPVKKVVIDGPKVPKEPKAPYKENKIIFEGNINEIMIGDETIEKRMPPRRKEVLKASSYYMNNRRLFQQKLADLFKPHKAELMKPDDDVSCDFRKEGAKFELLTHQKIVGDYLNLYSPYRGLLIYHGLGSGKTCTSIAIAEGMKSDRPIFILTPASLSMNYMSELKKCGDPLYKKNQFWEFVDTKKEPQHVKPLAIIMSLTEEFVRSQGGVWMVDVNKESNLDDLTKDQQEEIEDQIDEMIKAKYRNVNYNANNFMSKLEHYGGGESNPFDNSVVIVDEGHNLVSRIVNKLKKPQSNSVKLYKYLMGAVNAKVVFLSGTPIINYPNEIAIMFNMLRGYIKTWTFNLKVDTSEKISRDEILKWFNRDKLNLYDYVEYSSNKLIVTRNPYGFVNVKKRRTAVVEGAEEPDEFDKYGGVTLGEDGKMSDADFEDTIKRILKKHKVSVQGDASAVNHTALPDDKDVFLAMFIDPDTGIMKNTDLFQRRIIGLTSYFKSAQEKLLPRYNKATDFTIVPCEMNDYQFGVYATARKTERDQDAKKRKRGRGGGGGGGGGQTGELYKELSSSYRVFSRAFCNFAFPDPPGRPMPIRKFGETKSTNVSGKKPNKESFYRVLGLEKDADEEEVKKTYQTLALKYHPDRGESDAEKFKEIQEAYDCILHPEKCDAEMEYEEDLSEDDIDASNVDDETGEESKDSTYAAKINQALKYVKEHEGEFLVRDRLQMYSNKMLKLLDNVTDERHAGLHLIYSQFRTMEGIEIIKMILEANGYAEFKLVKQGGEWSIKQDDAGNEGKLRFVLYTGTETTEEKEIIRNIYNSNWTNVLPQIKVELEKIANNNYMGEIIKVFMITASGAEGINLENTRYVHVVEPYWHPVRMEQVIGRARRICSHSNLPEELRDVHVFLYLSVLSEEQQTNKKNIELRTKDIGRDKRPVTTDEYLFELSTKKDEITRQILKAVKETAMDCSLHRSKKGSSGDEQLVCYNFGKVASNEFSSLPVLEIDATQQTTLNVNKDTIKGITMKINGTKYIRKHGTNELYNAETMELEATLIDTGDGKVKIELL